MHGAAQSDSFTWTVSFFCNVSFEMKQCLSDLKLTFSFIMMLEISHKVRTVDLLYAVLQCQGTK